MITQSTSTQSMLQAEADGSTGLASCMVFWSQACFLHSLDGLSLEHCMHHNPSSKCNLFTQRLLFSFIDVVCCDLADTDGCLCFLSLSLRLLPLLTALPKD
jgi:hypothetical protein